MSGNGFDGIFGFGDEEMFGFGGNGGGSMEEILKGIADSFGGRAQVIMTPNGPAIAINASMGDDGFGQSPFSRRRPMSPEDKKQQVKDMFAELPEEVVKTFPREVREALKRGETCIIKDKTSGQILAEAKVGARDEEIVYLSKSIEKFSMQNTVQKEHIEGLERKKKKLKKKLGKKSDEVEDLQMQVARMEDGIDARTKAHVELEKVVSNKERALANLGRKLKISEICNEVFENSIADATEKLTAMKDLKKEDILEEIGNLLVVLEDTKSLVETERQKELSRQESSGHDC